MKYFSYLNTAAEITGLYKGQQPFHLFIKDFFRQYKKYGSSDRKQITHLCYCYFRLGASFKNITVPEKILTALFLCSEQDNEMLARLKPGWNEKISLSVEEKCAFLDIPFETLHVFPCTDELSGDISKNDFILSHFTQPDVFLRIRPGYRQSVLHKLEQEHINFSLPAENCVALPSTTKIDSIIDINKEAVVQDYSSQLTGALLQLAKPMDLPVTIWDCCAASGGKSIMAKDILGNIDLTVSDVRESVLVNLKKRFAEAGIQHFTTLVTDLAAPPVNLVPGTFRLIIADVPCTGSGTWGRTPERLSFFDKKEINRYTHLQQKIVSSVMPYLETNGFFLYITCSVFKKENEDMAGFIRENFAAELVKMESIKGYTVKADTMFAAIFRKNM